MTESKNGTHKMRPTSKIGKIREFLFRAYG